MFVCFDRSRCVGCAVLCAVRGGDVVVVVMLVGWLLIGWFVCWSVA